MALAFFYTLLNLYYSLFFKIASIFCNIVFVMSDSHSAINPVICKRLKNAKKIIHAGDWSTPEVYHDMLEITNDVYAVHGNTETREMDELLPEVRKIDLYGNKILIRHEIDSLKNFEIFGHTDEKIDIVIFGHTHKAFKKKIKGTVLYNPGSCGPKRFAGVAPSYGVIYFIGKFFFIRTHSIYFQKREGSFI